MSKIIEEIRNFILVEQKDSFKKELLLELDEDQKQIEKIKKLKNLGFEFVGNYLEKKDFIEKVEKNKKLKEDIEYYDKKYLGKFFTKSFFLNLNKKYGLVLGSSSLFKDKMPSNIIDDILNFDYDPEDCVLKTIMNKNKNFTLSNITNRFFYEEEKDNFNILNRDSLIKKYFFMYLRKYNLINHFKEERIFHINAKTFKDFVKNELNDIEFYSQYTDDVLLSKYIHFVIDPFKVIAKKDLFYIDFYHKLEAGEIIENVNSSDPIICLEVEGGYLYITAYDEDALIFNEEKFEQKIINN